MGSSANQPGKFVNINPGKDAHILDLSRSAALVTMFPFLEIPKIHSSLSSDYLQSSVWICV